jgi:hypothetical protein
VHVKAAAQMNLSFEPGLTAQFRTLEDCVQHVVLTARGGVDAVATVIDMAPGELSRRLSAHSHAKEGDSNNRPLRVGDFIRIIEITGDHRPIFWLLERFLSDPEAQRTAAFQQLAMLAPLIAGLAEQAGVSIPKSKGRR